MMDYLLAPDLPPKKLQVFNQQYDAWQDELTVIINEASKKLGIDLDDFILWEKLGDEMEAILVSKLKSQDDEKAIERYEDSCS